ncbi:MAG: hypothetical protein ACE5GO_06950 [Anaerolineales bacterium]
MLITVRGTYRRGQVELNDPVKAPDNTPVIITFLTPDGVELPDEQREAELLARSPTFQRLVERTLAEVEAGETVTFETLLDELPD